MSFDFNSLNSTAAGGGLQGPFINWQAKTSDNGQVPGLNWALRSKGDDNATRIDVISDQFKAGVVFDFHTIKLGWEKWAPMGQANDIQWAPGMNLEAFPRPTMNKRSNAMGRDVFEWQKIFAIRVAITPDLAGTWNSSQFGSTVAFDAFVDDLKAQGPQHVGKLPLVQWTGEVREDFGGAKVPVLKIADWKDAPACLKQDTGAGMIQTGTDGAAPPVTASVAAQPTPAQSAPAPAAASSIPTGAQF